MATTQARVMEVSQGSGVCAALCIRRTCVDMWRLVHQWSFLLFWLSFDCFWMYGIHCTNRQKHSKPLVYQLSQVYKDCTNSISIVKKRQSNRKKMTIGVPIVTCLVHRVVEYTKPRKRRYLARPPSHVPGQWLQPVACGQGWLYVSTWTSMRLAPVRCRVLIHSLLPADDACSSSSLSTTVIKFFLYFRTPLANFLLSRLNSVEYGNSKTTTLLPSAKCMRPLFQGRTGCCGRGIHPVGMISSHVRRCSRLVSIVTRL